MGGKNYRIISVWCLLSLLAAGGEISAQEEEELEVELFFAPAETVTSASRHIQALAESPSAVTVLTREDIEASGARTLPEVLRLVPNMDVDLVKPLWYAVGVRGGTSEASDSLLLLVDGRDVTLEFLGAPLWTTQHFSMEEVERIEVIRGPGSALYGANAYAGVVQVITSAAGTGPLALASARGGEHGAVEVACRGTRKEGPLALGISAGLTREDLWTGRGWSGRELVRGRVDGLLDLGPGNTLRVDAGAFRASGRLHSDVGEANVHKMVDLFARARLDFSQLMLQAAYDRAELDSDLGLRLYYKALGQDLARAPPIVGHTDKLSLQAQHALEVLHQRLTYGAEYVFNGYHAKLFIQPDQYEHRMGLFIQDEVNLSALVEEVWAASIPPLMLTLGLRYDHNSVTRGELSPRGALVFSPGENHSFRFGYAHAFLKPTFFESSLYIHLDSELGFDQLDAANPDLENQTIDSLELGYGGSFLDDRLLLNLDLAYNWYRKNIGFSYNPDRMNSTTIQGIRIPDISTKSEGFGFRNDREGDDGHNLDLQLIVRPTERSRVFLTVGYRQIFGSKSRAFATSNPVLRLAAGADLKSHFGLTLSLRAFYTGRYQRSIGNPEGVLEKMLTIQLPAAFFLNARVAWKVVSEPFNLSIGLEGFNLLGSRFRELGGVSFPNQPDNGGERIGRRMIFFVGGEIY